MGFCVLLTLLLVEMTASLRSEGTVPGLNLTLGWQFQQDFIEVEIKLKSSTFVPLLLDTSMTSSDLWYCSKEDNQTQWSVKDCWTVGHTQPENDTTLGGSNSIEESTAVATEDSLVCSFKRRLNTGDPYDRILQRGKTIKVCSYSSITTRFAKPASKDVRHCFYWPLIDGYQGVLSSEQQRSNWQLAHGIVLTICWGFLIDIALMVVRFLRTVGGYKIAHALFLFAINLASVPFIILMIVQQRVNIFLNFGQMETVNKVHLVFGLTILVLIVIEHSMGLATKFIQENRNLPPKRFEKTRLFHRLIGYTLFVLTKVQIILGWWVYGASPKLVTSLLVFWFVTLIVARAFLTDLYNKGKLQKFIRFFQISKTDQNSPPERLLPQDQSVHKSSQLLTAISTNKSLSVIRQEFPAARYVFFKDMVCDLQNFDHPGGASILQLAVGRDVTKYIYGGMPLEGTKTKLHQHSSYAISFLESKVIGTHIKRNVTLTNPDDWCVKTIQQLTPSLFKFVFYNQTFSMDTNPLHHDCYLGQYVLVTTKNATRAYTLLLSQLDTNVKYRRILLASYKHGFKYKQIGVVKESHTSDLALVIKRYEKGVVSQQVHYRKKLTRITGLYGIGLDIKPGVNVIITGGTGLLPFMDLFDLLLKKAIFTVAARRKIAHLDSLNLYGIDYQNIYAGSKFVVYASFKTIDQFKHFNWLNKLHEISAQNDLDLFQMYIKDHTYRCLKTYEGRVDVEFFDQRLFQGTFSKLFVCGPPGMNQEIVDILKLRKYEPSSYLVM